MWTFLANVMQAYTGNKETLFSHVACMESKQHMFWIHYLREPFSTKLTIPRCIDTSCSLHMVLTLQVPREIMNSCCLAPATVADGPGAVDITARHQLQQPLLVPFVVNCSMNHASLLRFLSPS